MAGVAHQDAGQIFYSGERGSPSPEHGPLSITIVSREFQRGVLERLESIAPRNCPEWYLCENWPAS
jgi:hypothetical protein